MNVEPGGVYRNGFGVLVHVVGRTRRPDGLDAVWSLEGNHYSPTGAFIRLGSLQDGPYGLQEKVGTHDDDDRGRGWEHAYCSVCYPAEWADRERRRLAG